MARNVLEKGKALIRKNAFMFYWIIGVVLAQYIDVRDIYPKSWIPLGLFLATLITGTMFAISVLVLLKMNTGTDRDTPFIAEQRRDLRIWASFMGASFLALILVIMTLLLI